MKTETEHNSALADLGFSLAIISGPTAGVDQENWPHIAYVVQLQFKGKTIIETPYKLGVGHVDYKKAKGVGGSINLYGWTDDEESVIYTLQRNPHARLKDKALHASVAAKLAKQQNVKPSLTDALHSLLSDGEAFFNAQSFEDWASEFGYPDSRKAESIYKTCDAIGRKLTQGIPSEALEAAHNILQD